MVTSEHTAQDRQHHDRHVPESVKQVTEMVITDQPWLFVLDAPAIWGGDDRIAGDIIRELALLAEHEGTRIVVRGVDDVRRQQLAEQVPADHLIVGSRTGPVDLPGLLNEQHAAPKDCLAILTGNGASAPEGCLAFFAGEGAPPAHTHGTRERTPAATNAILALYGTALAQDRAGVAFRNASKGRGIPHKSSFNRDILHGIVRSAAEQRSPKALPRELLPTATELRGLARKAYDRLLRNILPDGAVVGAHSRGQEPGKPNYWFFWQRDGAAAMSRLIVWQTHPPLGLPADKLRPTITRYTQFIRQTQAHGELGTSRYSVEGEPTRGYGNPQLDGPALSALALARIPDSSSAWTALAAYLDFLASPEGQGNTMDSWEFIYGRMYNAEFLRHVALLVGATWAERYGHGKEQVGRWREQAEQARRGLRDFEDARSGRILSSLDTYDPFLTSISRLDMSVVASLLAGWWARHDGLLPDDAGHGTSLDSHFWSLSAPAALATLADLEEVFHSLYQVNRDWEDGGNKGWGIGRFPEDANNGLGSSGGNPWGLCTLWTAQYYYGLALDLASQLKASPGGLSLADARQSDFFERTANGAPVPMGSTVKEAIWRERVIPALVRRGDAYLNFVVYHMPQDGAITEQIDRETGKPRGAPDLSWALAELIATIALREEAQPLAPAHAS
jgi:glucoamylase